MAAKVYAKTVSKKVTPQTEQAAPEQVKNNAGGYVFSLTIWDTLDRFLILGAEGNTYYCTEQKMVRQNATNLEACLREDGVRTVNRIVEVSEQGLAPKNDPAIFALAMACAAKDEATRKLATASIKRVCRTATHLFTFVANVKELRGFGSDLRKGINSWYLDRPEGQLGYQLVKYQQRGGWSHRDVLRLTHASPTTPQQKALLRYAVCGVDKVEEERKVDRKGAVTNYSASALSDLPKIVEGKLRVQNETDQKKVVQLIQEYNLTHEMIPNEVKKYPEVWEALLQKMPLMALIRNLGKMTNVGVLAPLSASTKLVVEKLHDQVYLQKSRIHPIDVLKALLTYSQGHGDKGKLTWSVQQPIVAALDESFYLAFKNIEPTGKNILLAIDISGSMDGGVVAGVQGLTPRIAAGAMAMATMRSEKNWHVVGYTSSGANGFYSRANMGVTPIAINPRMHLKTVCATMAALPMGGTDCALPIIYAQNNKMDVDTFISYTDNETWAGSIHPHQALKQYRNQVGKASKLIAVGMTATSYSVVDPSDPGSMNVVGFDSSAPAVMANFIRGPKVYEATPHTGDYREAAADDVEID